jgi:hypothetical protein
MRKNSAILSQLPFNETLLYEVVINMIHIYSGINQRWTYV